MLQFFSGNHRRVSGLSRENAGGRLLQNSHTCFITQDCLHCETLPPRSHRGLLTDVESIRWHNNKCSYFTRVRIYQQIIVVLLELILMILNNLKSLFRF